MTKYGQNSNFGIKETHLTLTSAISSVEKPSNGTVPIMCP